MTSRQIVIATNDESAFVGRIMLHDGTAAALIDIGDDTIARVVRFDASAEVIARVDAIVEQACAIAGYVITDALRAQPTRGQA